MVLSVVVSLPVVVLLLLDTIGGGLVAGTVLFGSPNVSIKRVINAYDYWFVMNK